MKNLYTALVKQKYLIIVCITGIIHLLGIYGHALIEPNNLLSVNDGDGIKNYYAYMTNISKLGANNQLSFNYPYGESYLFTDSHPFLSKTLHFVNQIFPGTEHNSIGILNILMILNAFFTYLVLFLLLRRFIKKEWYAMLWAFAIMLLQPQIDRLGGHLSLSYSLAIPLCFYWIVLYYQTNRKILYGVLLLLSNFLWLGTHVYLGVITCGFTFLFDAWQCGFYKEYRNKKDISLGIIKSILPLVIFYIYLAIIDIHTGRTTNPWGFFYNYSNLESIFLPYHGGGARLLQKIVPIPISQKWEGVSYVGLVTTICFWALVVFFIKRTYKYFRKRPLPKLPFEMGLFAPALFAAIICLLFSMGFPFKLGLKFLLDQMSFVKNFRATGRFAWPFFFVMTSLSAYAIYQYVQIRWQNRKRIIVFLLLIVPPIFTMVEAISYQKMTYLYRFRIENVFLRQNLDVEYQQAIDAINPQEYQAIIPLPFYQGSENFSKIAPGSIHYFSSIFAYHFELPLMASHLARSSIWESRNLIQMFAPEYYEKLVTKDIPCQKKFLIVCLSDENELTEYEHIFLQKATFLLRANDVEFWEITYDNMTEVVTTPYLEDFNEKREMLVSQENYLLSQPDTSVCLFSFDENASQYQFLGSGAYEQPKKEKYSFFAIIEPEKLEENRVYEASFWCYVGGKNYGQDKLGWMVYISQKDEETGEDFLLVEAGSKTTPVILGDWALSTYRFTIQNKKFPTRFVISSTNCKGYQTTVDELLVRPIDIDVYRVLEEDHLGVKKLYKNGQIIERN